MRSLRRCLFGLSPDEACFARRGFHAPEGTIRLHLEQVGYTFLQGYHAALEEDEPDQLASYINNTIAPVSRGFAFEGGAMALALLDLVSPKRGRRLQAFLAGPAQPHIYMAHVGAGWAMARLPWRAQWPPAWLDPLLGGLAIDGYGFHEGYFHWPRYADGKRLPAKLTGNAARIFDQGLGRSLWFVNGAGVPHIAATIGAFPKARRADLWSGVGLACAYAGGVSSQEIQALAQAGCHYLPQLAQGAAFAAKTRQRAGNPAAHTELACQVLCSLSAVEAAAITDAALPDRVPDRSPRGATSAYQGWRQRIQSQFAAEAVR